MSFFFHFPLFSPLYFNRVSDTIRRVAERLAHPMKKIDFRKIHVLKIIVEEYLKTGEIT